MHVLEEICDVGFQAGLACTLVGTSPQLRSAVLFAPPQNPKAILTPVTPCWVKLARACSKHCRY